MVFFSFARWRFVFSKIRCLHRVSKNVPPSTCCNLDTHDPITIIFGRSVTGKVRKSYDVLLSCLAYLVLLHYLQKRKPRRQRTVHCASNTIQLLQRYRLRFHLNHAPPTVTIAERIDYKTYGVIQQHEYES